jgi:hypothetical protein
MGGKNQVGGLRGGGVSGSSMRLRRFSRRSIRWCSMRSGTVRIRSNKGRVMRKKNYVTKEYEMKEYDGL